MKIKKLLTRDERSPDAQKYFDKDFKKLTGVQRKEFCENILTERIENDDVIIWRQGNKQLRSVCPGEMYFEQLIQETAVQFWYNEEQRDVFAAFPKTLEGLPGVEVYSTQGQHSMATYDYIKTCIPATVKQYEWLKEELEDLGYNLKIVK